MKIYTLDLALMRLEIVQQFSEFTESHYICEITIMPLINNDNFQLNFVWSAIFSLIENRTRSLLLPTSKEIAETTHLLLHPSPSPSPSPQTLILVNCKVMWNWMYFPSNMIILWWLHVLRLIAMSFPSAVVKPSWLHVCLWR